MTCEVGSRYTEQGNLLADCPGEASERGVSYDSTSRAELAVEKGSGNDSACGGASEPERSRDNIQNVNQGQASQWRPYMQKGKVSSMDLDAICMPTPRHHPQ